MATALNGVESAQQHVDSFAAQVRTIRAALHEVVVGQDDVIDQLLICALCGSHALLVGVPGLAKTLMVKALAAAFRWKFSRIQFTPDLMPADVTGYELLGRSDDGQGPTMVFRHGPVFANLVLADEINRAAPKTQSALLEAMAERHVTVGGKTYPLEEPFLVAATQNPIEQEGTYPLPEAQLDRFMMEIRIGYPSPEQEEEIVLRTTAGHAGVARGLAGAGGVPAAPRSGVGRAGGRRTWRPTRCGSAARAGRKTPAAASSSATTWPGAPARAARRTWCWRPRPGRCCWAAPPRRPRTSGRRPCRSSATGSSSTIGRWATRSPRPTSSTTC